MNSAEGQKENQTHASHSRASEIQGKISQPQRQDTLQNTQKNRDKNEGRLPIRNMEAE